MGGSLPFQDLLEALRGEGFPVGVHDHLALARLVERYDGTSRAEFRAAVAALLGHDTHGVERVKALFDMLYPEELGPQDPAVKDGVGVLVIALVVALVIAFVAAVYRMAPPHEQPDGGNPGAGMFSDARPDAGLRADGGDQPPLELPKVTPKADFNPWTAGLVLATVIGTLAVAGRSRATRERERQTRAAWRSHFERLPGPRRYSFAIDPKDYALEPGAVVRAAALLSTATNSPSEELDMDRTVDATARAGRLPVLVYKRSLSKPRVLALIDSSAETRPWARRIEQLVKSLEFQGVEVARWYFHGVPEEVAPSPLERRRSISALANETGEWSLMVLSSARGLTIEEQRRAAKAVARWPSRAWLNPVLEPGRWSGFFQDNAERLPMYPLTEDGLIGAAERLRGVERRVTTATPDSFVTRDVLLLRAMLSLSPTVTYELAEALRRHFLPWVSPDIVLAVQPAIDAGFRAAANDEIRAARAWLQAYDPEGKTQDAVRRYLLRVLELAQPAKEGSIAWLRWRKDRALLALQLEHAPDERQWVRDEIDALAQSELGRELSEDLERIAPELSQESQDILKVFRKREWRGPIQARHWLLPSVAVLGVLTLVLAIGVWGSWRRPEVVQGFKLEYLGPSSEFLVARLLPAAAGIVPQNRNFLAMIPTFRVVRDRQQPATNKIWISGPANGVIAPDFRTIELLVKFDASDTGHEFHLTNTAIPGKLLVSNVVRVLPATAKVEVIVDAVLGNRMIVADIRLRRDAQAGWIQAMSGDVLLLEPGEWQIEVMQLGEFRWYDPINVVKGKDNHFTIKVTDTPKAQIVGVVSIRAKPPGVADGDITVAGIRYRGFPIEVPAGKQIIAIKNVFYDYSTQVSVNPKGKVDVDLFASPRYGVGGLHAPGNATLTVIAGDLQEVPRNRVPHAAIEADKTDPTLFIRGTKGRIKLNAPGMELETLDVSLIPGRYAAIRQLSVFKAEISPPPSREVAGTGTIFIRTKPSGVVDGDITVAGGVYQGKPMEVPVGSQTVTIRNLFYDSSMRVVVHLGEKIELDVPYSPTYGVGGMVLPPSTRARVIEGDLSQIAPESVPGSWSAVDGGPKPNYFIRGTRGRVELSGPGTSGTTTRDISLTPGQYTFAGTLFHSSEEMVTLSIFFEDNGKRIEPVPYLLEGYREKSDGSETVTRDSEPSHIVAVGRYHLIADVAGFEGVSEYLDVDRTRNIIIQLRRAEEKKIKLKLPPALSPEDILVDGKAVAGDFVITHMGAIVRVTLANPFFNYVVVEFKIGRDRETIEIGEQPTHGGIIFYWDGRPPPMVTSLEAKQVVQPWIPAGASSLPEASDEGWLKGKATNAQQRLPRSALMRCERLAPAGGCYILYVPAGRYTLRDYGFASNVDVEAGNYTTILGPPERQGD